MSLVDRAKNILLTPKTEWPKIDSEPGTIQGLFTSYAMILALLPVIGTILFGLTFSGPFGVRLGMNYIIVSAILGYIVSLGVLYLMTIIADALAPSFDGSKDQFKTAKMLVYSATAVWIGGAFTFIPVIGILLALAGFGYAAYLLYLGCQIVKGIPEKNAIGYTAVTIVIWIIVSFVINAILSRLILSSMVNNAVIYGV